MQQVSYSKYSFSIFTIVLANFKCMFLKIVCSLDYDPEAMAQGHFARSSLRLLSDKQAFGFILFCSKTNIYY